MLRTKLAVTGFVLAFSMLAGCQGDSYWRAKQSADFREMQEDIEDHEERQARAARYETTRYESPRNESPRYTTAPPVYDPRHPGGVAHSYRTEGFTQDDYWGDPAIRSYPRDTYAYPRDANLRDPNLRDPYPRDTYRTTPRELDLLD